MITTWPNRWIYSYLFLDDLYKLVDHRPLPPGLPTYLYRSLRSHSKPLRFFPWPHEPRNCRLKFDRFDIWLNFLVPVYTDASLFRSDAYTVEICHCTRIISRTPEAVEMKVHG